MKDKFTELRRKQSDLEIDVEQMADVALEAIEIAETLYKRNENLVIKYRTMCEENDNYTIRLQEELKIYKSMTRNLKKVFEG